MPVYPSFEAEDDRFSRREIPGARQKSPLPAQGGSPHKLLNRDFHFDLPDGPSYTPNTLPRKPKLSFFT